MHSFILFLDFDGVLHRGTTSTVRHAPALATLLEKHPRVKVVISSTWRLLHSLKELREWLPPSMASNVIDATPVLEQGTSLRQREIELWLRNNPARDWVALDDEAALFETGYAHLHLTDGSQGLTALDLQTLDTRLAQSLSQH